MGGQERKLPLITHVFPYPQLQPSEWRFILFNSPIVYVIKTYS